MVLKLRETGMWLLVTTRDGSLVRDAKREPVTVNELSDKDARLVLRRAVELPEDVRLPDTAIDVAELCGCVAMDLAFVGRWSVVRGRKDSQAWEDAIASIRTELDKMKGGGASDGKASVLIKQRREAILRAGLERLGLLAEDERIQHLHLSLAMMPDGYFHREKRGNAALRWGVQRHG